MFLLPVHPGPVGVALNDDLSTRFAQNSNPSMLFAHRNNSSTKYAQENGRSKLGVWRNGGSVGTAQSNTPCTQFAQSYPTLSRLLTIMADGQFKNYLQDTHLATFEDDLRNFEEEGNAFRNCQIFKVKVDQKYIGEMNAFISGRQKNLEDEATANAKANTNDVIRDGNEKFEKLVTNKQHLQLLETNRDFLQQDVDIRMRIEKAATTAQNQQRLLMRCLLRIKVDQVYRRPFDPVLNSAFMDITKTITTHNQARLEMENQVMSVRKMRSKWLHEQQLGMRSVEETAGSGTDRAVDLSDEDAVGEVEDESYWVTRSDSRMDIFVEGFMRGDSASIRAHFQPEEVCPSMMEDMNAEEVGPSTGVHVNPQESDVNIWAPGTPQMLRAGQWGRCQEHYTSDQQAGRSGPSQVPYNF